MRLTLTLLTKATTKHTNINPKHTQRRQYKHDKQKTATSPRGTCPKSEFESEVVVVNGGVGTGKSGTVVQCLGISKI